MNSLWTVDFMKTANIETLIAKMSILGSIDVIVTKCGHKIYVLKFDKTHPLIYIPDDVTDIGYLENPEIVNGLFGESLFLKYNGADINIGVFGGNNLKTCQRLFSGIICNTLDLSSFNTSHVRNMIAMFYDCKISNLNLDGLNTSEVIDMGGMFNGATIDNTDYSNLDVSRVVGMQNMFAYNHSHKVDLSSFKATSVKDVRGMFDGALIETLILGDFSKSPIEYCESMFSAFCTKSDLDLRKLNLSNATSFDNMFSASNIKSINLSNLHTPYKLKSVARMFMECRAELVDLRNFKLSNINVTYVNEMFSSSNMKVIMNDGDILAYIALAYKDGAKIESVYPDMDIPNSKLNLKSLGITL